MTYHLTLFLSNGAITQTKIPLYFSKLIFKNPTHHTFSSVKTYIFLHHTQIQSHHYQCKWIHSSTSSSSLYVLPWFSDSTCASSRKKHAYCWVTDICLKTASYLCHHGSSHGKYPLHMHPQSFPNWQNLMQKMQHLNLVHCCLWCLQSQQQMILVLLLLHFLWPLSFWRSKPLTLSVSLKLRIFFCIILITNPTISNEIIR